MVFDYNVCIVGVVTQVVIRVANGGGILETRQLLCTTETNGIIFNSSNIKTAA